MSTEEQGGTGIKAGGPKTDADGNPIALELDEEMEEDEKLTQSQLKAKVRRKRTIFDTIVYSAAGASFAFQAAAMAIERSVVVYVAGVIGILVVPVTAVSQLKLQDTDGLRRIQNKLRKEVNRLMAENNKLHDNVDELETQVGGLKKIEGELQDIATTQGTNVEQLVSLVKENQILLDAMNRNLKATTVETLLQIVLRSDRDESFHISGDEVDILMLRMQNVEGVEIDEHRLRKKIEKSGGDLSCVIQMIKDMVNKDLPEEEQIFSVHAEKMHSKKTLQP